MIKSFKIHLLFINNDILILIFYINLNRKLIIIKNIIKVLISFVVILVY